MRFLVHHRAFAAAQRGCSSSLHRLTLCQPPRGSCLALSWCPSCIESGRRLYSTTAVLHKHSPTTPGSSSGSTARQGNRKHAGHPSPSSTATHARCTDGACSGAAAASGASAAAAVEPELQSTPALHATAAGSPLVSCATAAAAAVASSVGTARRLSGKATASARSKVARRSRQKQDGAAALHSSSATVVATGAAASARRRQTASAKAAVVMAAQEEATRGGVSALSGADASGAKKRTKERRGKRRAVGRGIDAASAKKSAANTAATTTSATSSRSSSAMPSVVPTPPFLGAVAPVYATHNMLDTSPRTEEQRMAERCSIMKLIMVSASVSFLFTALPRSEGQLKSYVRDMNRVQVPAPALEAVSFATPADPSSSSPSLPTAPSITSKEFHELRQRLCSEQFATNTVFIHVREMEQLVPPLHLQPPSALEAGEAAAAPSASTVTSSAARDTKTRNRRTRRGRSDGAASPLSSATPPLPALTPVQRLLALQEWKKAALRRAKESQARHPLPAHFHAITRVRFHDPHQTDLTVAMGGGSSKSPESVLRAIVRSVPQEESRSGSGGEPAADDIDSGSGGDWLAGEEEDDDADGGLPPFPLPDSTFASGEVVTEAAAEPEQPAFLASPYAVKPLLTVCASCVPRREAWIGTCSPQPSTATADGAEGSAAYAFRDLPSLPRYSTRITIMLEHDDMDPADLVSLAEISTTRKPAPASAAHGAALDRRADVSVRGGGVDLAGGDDAWGGSDGGRPSPKRPLQLYCLVQNAGEY